MSANRARGEVVLQIDGAPARLCVTLGALAELEAAFDVVSFEELGARLAKMSAADLLLVVGALCSPRRDARALAGAEIDPKEAARAVADCFALAFGDG